MHSYGGVLQNECGELPALRQIRRSPYSSRSARVSSAPTHSSPVGASTLWRFWLAQTPKGPENKKAPLERFLSPLPTRGEAPGARWEAISDPLRQHTPQQGC